MKKNQHLMNQRIIRQRIDIVMEHVTIGIGTNRHCVIADAIMHSIKCKLK